MNQKNINTVVDGEDVERVYAWDHPTEKNKVSGYFLNNDEVTVVEEKDEYIKIKGVGHVYNQETRKTKKSTISGWCLGDFVK